MRKIYVILVEYCMKLTLLSAWKGDNYYKNVEKAYNFRMKSGIGKCYIAHIALNNDQYHSLVSLFGLLVFTATYERSSYVKACSQINVREYQRDNQKWTIQRNWQHRVHKRKKNKTKTQHTMCLTPLYANKHK